MNRDAESVAGLTKRAMVRRNRMCATCPFRGADDAYKRECSEIQPENWACHSEGYFGADTNIQCRGHYEARRKFTYLTLQEKDNG